MLFNLGMTADAAAAHDSELASSQSEIQLSMPSRHSSPRPFSLTNLPSWVSRSRSVREKGTPTERPRFEQRRSMPITTVEAISSSDEDQHSTAGPSPVRHNFSTSRYSKQPSPSRPKTIYQLAHPATNARHKRLKLRPKLLLQLQQVSATTRPVPVFDVLPSTLFMPKLARKVPAILRGKRGLGPNDLIVTASDLYQGDVDKNVSSDEEEDHNEVVATICQPCKEDALSKGKAEICLNTGAVLEATPLPNGSYEFAATTESGLVITRWVRRGPRKRRLSAPSGSVGLEDARRFTFSVIDPTTRRHPVIASMAHNHLEIYNKYSLPSTAPSSPTSAMSIISDVSEDIPLDQQVVETDENLRLLITITSIWVAFREGWSHNFRYNDAAANGKATRSPSVSKNISATVLGNDGDRTVSRRNSLENHTADPNRRIVTWTTAGSQSPAVDGSTRHGSLSRRSNSTGAAFIERSNKRNSSTNRQSVLPTPRQSYEGQPELKTVQQNSVCRSWSQRKVDRRDSKLDSKGIHSKTARQSTQEASQTPNGHQQSNGHQEPSRPTKGKRRHRLSNIFDFITRKSGHRHD